VTSPVLLRRARPALGTLVEIGICVPDGHADASAGSRAKVTLEAAYAAISQVERAMSAFDPASDVGCFNAAPAGTAIRVARDTAVVLRAARALGRRSGGLLDVSLGTGAGAWSLSQRRGETYLHKRAAEVRLDLGGIAKGYAVDRAFETLGARLAGTRGAACWVNAGGDLRVYGVELPIHLRDERVGGARPWLLLRDGALATSHFGPGARAAVTGRASGDACHVSVVSPRCLWSDALTKVVALHGRSDHPILRRYGACAWVHPVAGS
jgi:FAD:protein FMN transferase